MMRRVSLLLHTFDSTSIQGIASLLLVVLLLRLALPGLSLSLLLLLLSLLLSLSLYLNNRDRYGKTDFRF